MPAASGAGRDVDRKALKTTGYAIRNAGNSVFLIGGRENGVLNAVYRFLREQFRFECYAADEIALDTNVRNAKLLDFKDVSETPDITFYGAAQTETMLNQIYARRLGMAQQADWIVELGGTFYHNWLGTIPKDDYQAAHPDWYSPSGTQLCLTRDADGLANEVFKKIVEVLQKNPSGYAIGFTQQDDGGWCTCDECTEVAKRYGANSATQILFMNKLWDLVEDWLKVNMPEREVYLYMFAYEYIAKHGVDYLFDEDRSGGARKMSDWSRLRFYLRAKLAWDTDADLLSYADAFFANYYKAAAKTMRQIFDEYSSHYAALIAEHHLRGQGGVIDILEPDFWPKGLLDRWMRLFDKAYEDIEFLKESDPALYSVLEERIRLDSVSLRYLCISLYGEDNCIYKGNGNTVAEDAKYFGMSYIG